MGPVGGRAAFTTTSASLMYTFFAWSWHEAAGTVDLMIPLCSVPTSGAWNLLQSRELGLVRVFKVLVLTS